VGVGGEIVSTETLLKQLSITEGKLRVMNQLILADVVAKAGEAIRQLTDAQCVDVKQLIADYEAASDEGGWESPHPIFRMALEVDHLRGVAAELRAYKEAAEGPDQLSDLDLVHKALQSQELCMACFDDGYLIYQWSSKNSSGNLVRSFWKKHDLIAWVKQLPQNPDRCPSHESGQIPDEELPGMWSNSDLQGGWADSSNESEQSPAAPALPDVDWLAQVIRKADGKHDLGACGLAEAIIDAMASAQGCR
jgi:hypothetical protein